MLDRILNEWEAPGIWEVRDTVKAFSMLMEKVLRDNDHKGGWQECDPRWLLAKLNEEVGELGKALTIQYLPDGRELKDYPDTNGGRGMIDNIIRECVDVANVAMMMADIFSQRLPDREIGDNSGKGCPVMVWDGPCAYRCGMGGSGNVCHRHGKF